MEAAITPLKWVEFETFACNVQISLSNMRAEQKWPSNLIGTYLGGSG